MQNPASIASAPKPPIKEVPFGVNAMRLTVWHWILVAGLVALALVLVPRAWKIIERFDTGPDYRVPYTLSQDYWLYERWLGRAAVESNIVVLGDSVIWGEYVLPDGTLSHFLNRATGRTNRFVNAGVNGMFPLALEGLVHYYGGALRHKKVLLHCNLLWMSSPKADLQTEKEEKFNHSRLVPQFFPRIPCYRADANERLGAIVERHVGLSAWVNHLQHAYFDGKSILNWTLRDNGGEPPQYPNSYKNPLAQIRLAVPLAPTNDPARGPDSSRHVAWSKNGARPAQFEWVTLESSFQWCAFQRLVDRLRKNGDEVFILVGPFNEHMIAGESRPAYRRLRDGVTAWLAQNRLPYCAPDPLPGALYADGSHPLTEGYAQLARTLLQNSAFQSWMK